MTDLVEVMAPDGNAKVRRTVAADQIDRAYFRGALTPDQARVAKAIQADLERRQRVGSGTPLARCGEEVFCIAPRGHGVPPQEAALAAAQRLRDAQFIAGPRVWDMLISWSFEGRSLREIDGRFRQRKGRALELGTCALDAIADAGVYGHVAGRVQLWSAA
jgi:hypothetical protein